MARNLTTPRAVFDSQPPHPKGSGRRYPVDLELRYKLFRNRTVVGRGTGKAREFVAGKIIFGVDRPLAVGSDLELSLDWPLRIDGVCPLCLLVFGRVLESGEEGSTLKIARYEFRARSSQVMAPREAVSRSGFRIHVGTTSMHARRG